MRVATLQAARRRANADVELPFDSAAPATYLERRIANFGDYVVIDSMLKLVDVEVVRNFQFGKLPEGPLPEIDHLIVRGSNFIRPNLDLTPMGEIIERFGVPVTVMGIGAQAAAYGSLALSGGTIRALRILGEHSKIVGTRGAYTAEILKGLGVDNVEPIGCPSFFRGMNRDLTISFDPDARGAVAYNMNRHMAGIYGSNHVVVNRMQRDFFIQLRRAFDVVSTFCQGETAEFIAAHRLSDHYGVLRKALVHDAFADTESDPIIDDLIKSAVCATSIVDWERRVSKSDLALGMRFHGTTVGLSNGVPAIYLVNDTRVHEMAAYFGVPYLDLRNLPAPPSIESIFEAADFSAFNAQYADRFDRFANYLLGNGLPSNIQAEAPVGSDLRYEDSALHPGHDAQQSARWLRSQLAWAGERVAGLQKEAELQEQRVAELSPTAR
jgi:hypothetical protein